MYVIRVQGVAAIEKARTDLQHFLLNPHDSRYRQASWQHGQASRAPSTFNYAHVMQALWSRTGPFSATLLVLSLVVTLVAGFGENEAFTFLLWFHLPSIFSGQVHRIIAPIFLHLSVIHLLFNAMWLWDLGGALEKRLGARALLLLVLLVGSVSNFTQYLSSGPFFGGMSGVVYGLLGYLWLRGRCDPRLALRVNPGIITFMLLWLLLGFSGVLGPVANAAHLSGLAMGMALGFVASPRGEKNG